MEITKVVSSGVTYSSLPNNYIHPPSDRPRLSEVYSSENIPVIDLGTSDRAGIIRQIAHACTNYGFFLVINHEVPKETMENMLRVSNELFKLPLEEKLKLYSDDISKPVRLSTSFNINKEKVHSWRDCLRLHCYPFDKYLPHWPSNPPSFKEIVSNYCIQIRQLGFRLEDMISESLGLKNDEIRNVLGEQGQYMIINMYPACPEPELTYGIPAHTDPQVLSVLLPDPHVKGLQVLKDGKWLDVKPIDGALVINIGDQLQALSNGRYKSVWHRAIVNSNMDRISIGSFFGPSHSTIISPVKSLVKHGSNEAAVYRDYTYGEYQDMFFNKELDQVQCLELFKNN